MVKYGLIALTLFTFAALPTLIDAGASCNLSTKCPDVTVTPAKTTEYCNALKTHVECLGGLGTDADCTGDQAAIASKITIVATNHKTYKCGGVAGLVGSTIMCLIVCVMSMVVKT